ncbi:T9SS C-terminal target domain-containing protein [Rhodohalobacter sp. SW132]|uniref:family 43 glycosylhydrolase n=1 Tax=Rhodohalobacter sp. SW132 TaxID=2293433 RepID=UPI000E22DCE5|nr:family 43 glycosylhydrolase [Rhodohalobacter sp. SW132]REL38125.1 T9SS C-terminal target domain-containing protein [Rhodohalobacter sp. SW132]
MKKIVTICLLSIVLLICLPMLVYSQSGKTFINPIIPGDHPDPTLTKIGNYFYSSGSSFNPTPKIYRSTDLVHWEAIAQPVKASWSTYGDQPGGGAWGGHTVYHHGKYWHYFGRGGGNMYFVTANAPTAGWSDPVELQRFGNLPPYGVDNSIFIDEETGKWYLLTKAGHENNHMIELGENGQPTGEFLDLTWLNPDDEGLPYGWAEGPVMWKHNDFYYYSFAEHLVGEQYVMRSDTLTDNPDDWEIMSGNMYYGSRGTFDRPNHISPAVTLDDGTSWAIGHSYHTNNNWQAQGRQGLLHEITYEDGWPRIEFPPSHETDAPNLPNINNIPWMVPKSDMFNTARLNPAWSVLGYTPDGMISLSDRAGWVRLEPHNNYTSLIQNDGEHQYSAITRVDFEPDADSDQAGLWIINGPQNLSVRVYSSANAQGDPILGFRFDDTVYEVENTVGSAVWLKLIRNDHTVSGYFSDDGDSWTQIGEEINAIELGRHQNDFNDFTGNQQGLFVEGKAAFFDLYVYRDAYTEIMGRKPANYSGARPSGSGSFLGSISNGDWAMYAGVQFGTSSPSNSGVDYQKSARQINLTASSNGHGGVAEVWLGGIENGEMIAEVQIEDTGSNASYSTFSAPTARDITGSHDVYLRFTGSDGVPELFRLQSLSFSTEITTSSESIADGTNPREFRLQQNYPNPFNPSTVITYQLPAGDQVSLKVFDMLGREVATLVDGMVSSGEHRVTFDASNLTSGMYIYRLQAGERVQTRKMMLIK